MATDKPHHLWGLPEDAGVMTMSDGLSLVSHLDGPLNDGFTRVAGNLQLPVVSFPENFLTLDADVRMEKLWQVHETVFSGLPPADSFVSDLLRGTVDMPEAQPLVMDMAAVLLLDDMEDVALIHLNDFLKVLGNKSEDVAVRQAALHYIHALEQNYTPYINLCDRYEIISTACAGIVQDEPETIALANDCLKTLATLVTQIKLQARLPLADIAVEAANVLETQEAAAQLLAACRAAYPHGHGLVVSSGSDGPRR